MTLSMHIYRFFILAIIFAFLCEGINPAFAQETASFDPSNISHSTIDSETAAKGYEAVSVDGVFKLSCAPGVISVETAVDIEKIADADMPWRLQRVSDTYQFDFSNKKAYNGAKPFVIQIATAPAIRTLVQIFYYDTTRQTWKPLPTQSASDGSFVRATIHLSYARVAAFRYPDVLAAGEASWYAHKKGAYAASPDFPRGSRVRVHNLSNGKYVDVTINDYGPDRTLHPNRVIDLEKAAFKRIAPLGTGLVSVRVEPLTIISVGAAVLGIPTEGIGSLPQITSKAALVIDEESGDILYEKNADEPLPIASLSKLVAVRVFLDTRPSLNTVVTYRIHDERLNRQYVDDPSQAARLKVKDGETVTIEDLLYASLVGSANNTIESLVRISGLTREEFIRRMNDSATLWGARTAHFDDPTGLSPKNVSSARDFAILAKEAFRNPIIQKASVTKQYVFTTLNTKKRHIIKNTNALVSSGALKLTGSKTGYLHEAGYCLIARMNYQSRTIIALAFGDSVKQKNTAHIATLLQYGKAFAQQKSLAQKIAAK